MSNKQNAMLTSSVAGLPAPAVQQIIDDDAQLVADMADPLPEGSTWHEFGGAEIELLLAHTSLVDAEWLLKFALGEVLPELKGVVPAWQHLPLEAKVGLKQLRKSKMVNLLPVVVLSYGWAGKQHPDPTGEQLRSLIPVLRALVASSDKGLDKEGSFGAPVAWGIVWDYMSLPQRGRTTGYDASFDDRTPYELDRFKRGLRSINVWYSAQRVTTLVLDHPLPKDAQNTATLDMRGWCIFERRLSSITKDGWCCLTLSLLPRDEGVVLYWRDIIMACRGSRHPPLKPEEFEHMMRDGIAREAAEPGTGFRFTNGKDASEVCMPQYREAFMRLMRDARCIAFGGCRWGNNEVEQLTTTLAWAHTQGLVTHLSTLNLRNNEFSDAAVVSLDNLLSLGALSGISTLFLDGNHLTDTGAQSLAAMLSDGKLPKLEMLQLDSNEIGDAGALALAEAIQGGSTPALQSLVLGGNAFGEAAFEELHAACQGRSIRAVRWYTELGILNAR